MAFFQNTKPNSVAGISLPADGADYLTIHCMVKNIFGGKNSSYLMDRQFFRSLKGARTTETFSGCMIEFYGKNDILNALEASVEYFDYSILSQVHRRRNHAEEDALRFRVEKSLPMLQPELGFQDVDYTVLADSAYN